MDGNDIPNANQLCMTRDLLVLLWRTTRLSLLSSAERLPALSECPFRLAPSLPIPTQKFLIKS